MAKKRKKQAFKHQREEAAGEKTIHITYVVNKYSGIDVGQGLGV